MLQQPSSVDFLGFNFGCYLIFVYPSELHVGSAADPREKFSRFFFYQFELSNQASRTSLSNVFYMFCTNLALFQLTQPDIYHIKI